MHPVQAAPRQSAYRPARYALNRDAPRAGSAEAKREVYDANCWRKDAPRAGSAEAKRISTA